MANMFDVVRGAVTTGTGIDRGHKAESQRREDAETTLDGHGRGDSLLSSTLCRYCRCCIYSIHVHAGGDNSGLAKKTQAMAKEPSIVSRSLETTTESTWNR